MPATIFVVPIADVYVACSCVFSIAMESENKSAYSEIIYEFFNIGWKNIEFHIRFYFQKRLKCCEAASKIEEERTNAAQPSRRHFLFFAF